MTWRTHAAVGANTVWLVWLLMPLTVPATLLMAVAGFAALLPDIEADFAKIQFFKIAGAQPFRIFRGTAQHRGFVHSFLATTLIAVACFIWLGEYGVELVLAITFGFASHILIDGFNTPGVCYLYPWKKRLFLLPRAWRFPLYSFREELLFIAGVVGILFFLLKVVLPSLSLQIL